MKFSYIIVLLIVIVLVVYLLRAARAYKYTKRISKYITNDNNEQIESLGDKITNIYYRVNDRIVNSLKKSTYFKNISKIYEKYSYINNPLNIIASKFIISFSLGVFYILVSIYRNNFDFFILLLLMTIGYFVYNLYLIISIRIRNKHIENDLLKAIIIMNNAFKSGYNITQAITFVSKDLTGDICTEFEKISADLKFGLDINDVFNRFYERVKIDDVKYITSSLNLLNLTGGNLVGVFESIEKSFTNRKRIQNELNAMTSSSKLVFYILLTIPILLVIMINILNPTYYAPLFKNPIGYLIIIIICILYIVYIFIIRKILKVE